MALIAAIAAGTEGSAKPSGHSTTAREASTLITTFVWYSPGANAKRSVRARPSTCAWTPPGIVRL